MHRAFPLISIAITAIFITIQFSLPLSLGLLGALSIVRFRTPVKEPEEIGFLMIVVATSLCCATFKPILLGIVLFVVTLTLLCLHGRRFLVGGARSDGVISLTLPCADYQEHGAQLLSLLESQLAGGSVEAVVETPEEAVISYKFPAMDRSRLPELQEAWRGISKDLRADVFFTRESAG